MRALAWLALALAVPLFPADDALPTGVVIDPVRCLDDPAQGYALYLPSAYRPGRPCPVVYCFDPGGRGRIPVELFRDGAEKHGWILVGSNNARNGPWEAIHAATQAFWRDTRARFAIDGKRIYAAGFSGGARAACGLSRMLSIRVAGVIGCGAGLPEWLEPADMSAVPWYGIVGLRDFNYHEMQQLERALRAQGGRCVLRMFQGKHSWPPARLAADAFDWLEELAAGPEAHSPE